MPLSGHTIKSMGVREVARVSMWQLTISGIVTSLNYVSDDFKSAYLRLNNNHSVSYITEAISTLLFHPAPALPPTMSLLPGREATKQLDLATDI